MSEQSADRKLRLPPAAIAAIIMAAICAVSLYIRIYVAYDEVFVNGWIWFRETDAYYFMRHVENMVQNFPHFNAFDPYALYPGGGVGLYRPFFVFLIAGISRLVSVGPPTLHTMQVVGAVMPAVLGTLALIPVYFIGKELFNRWVGIISAALVAVLPGEFLNRSLVGFADQHMAEVLFSTVTILFLIMAIKRSREREISFSHVLAGDWPTITRPLIYTLVAAIFLGIYLLTWVGGLLLIFIIFAYLVIQFIIDHLRQRSTDYLCIIGTPVFLIAFLMLLPVLGGGSREMAYRAAMLIAIMLPIVLSIISRLMAGRAWKPVYYPLTLVGLAGIALGILYAVNPDLFGYMSGLFGIFSPTGAALTVLEIQGLTASMAWGNFNTSFFIAFISLAMLIYVAFKEKSAAKTLFLVWSVIMLMAVLGQRRFGYYYVINAALLTGYFSWKLLDIAGLGRLLTGPKEIVRVAKAFKKKKKTVEKAAQRTFMQPRGTWVRVIVMGIVVFFLVFFPSLGLWREQPTRLWGTGGQAVYIGFTRYTAERPPIIDEGWYTSCLWLKDNTPDPFNDPGFYYELYPPRGEFEYPETAYGVMSWWDYGHFMMQLGHRIPNANPMQAGADRAGEYFTAQNASTANELLDKWGSKYVAIDNDMATGKFYAMAEWAGKDPDDFYEIYYLPQQGGGQWLPLYYPTYYNSTAARLYNFDGKAVTPTEAIVIAYEEKVTGEGDAYKEITDGQQFFTYEEAEAYVAAQVAGNYRIVGTSPFNSPVPLEELNSYELIHSSNATTTSAGQTLPSVKIFEYLGSDNS